jgi:hypothetical protein
VLHDRVAYHFFLFQRALIVKVNIFETLRVISISTPFIFSHFLLTSNFSQVWLYFMLLYKFRTKYQEGVRIYCRERGYWNVMDETGSISCSKLGFCISGVKPWDAISRQFFFNLMWIIKLTKRISTNNYTIRVSMFVNRIKYGLYNVEQNSQSLIYA